LRLLRIDVLFVLVTLRKRRRRGGWSSAIICSTRTALILGSPKAETHVPSAEVKALKRSALQGTAIPLLRRRRVHSTSSRTPDAGFVDLLCSVGSCFPVYVYEYAPILHFFFFFVSTNSFFFPRVCISTTFLRKRLSRDESPCAGQTGWWGIKTDTCGRHRSNNGNGNGNDSITFSIGLLALGRARAGGD